MKPLLNTGIKTKTANQLFRPSRGLAHHVLSASSNLIGICFILLGYIKVSKLDIDTHLDEALIVPILLFFITVASSYHSLRSNKKAATYENIADWSFILGLISLSVISIYFVIADYI